MTAGNPGCPCTNTTATLSSLAAERSCVVTETGQAGVLLALGGSCVPPSYGSSRCLQHDLRDPACRFSGSIFDGGIADDVIVPPYCLRSWVSRAAPVPRCSPVRRRRTGASIRRTFPLTSLFSATSSSTRVSETAKRRSTAVTTSISTRGLIYSTATLRATHQRTIGWTPQLTWPLRERLTEVRRNIATLLLVVVVVLALSHLHCIA